MSTAAQSIYTGGTINLPEISDHDLIMHFGRNSILCTSETSNTKLAKSYKLYPQYRNAYVALLPADHSGINVCPRHAHCKTHCIGISAGRNRFDNSIIGKYYRTLYYARFRSDFIAQLSRELTNFQTLCARTGRTGAVRLNAFSDIAYEIRHPELFANCPDITFYDYTKINNRKVKHISNYHLTFSKADGNDMDTRLAISNGMNVAVVFHKVPENYLGRPVINGDETDLRFLDPKGVIVGLKAKGKAKKDLSGFVVTA